MTPDEIRDGMAKLQWFHQIDLGHGIVTPGAGGPDWIRKFQARADVYYQMGIEGQTVLDMCAFDGFFSFAAERAGAARVVAADWFVWNDGFKGGNRLPSFEFAKKALGSKVEKLVADIGDVSVKTHGQFDHVGLNGVLYHILDPIDALIRMAGMTRRVLSVDTHVDCQDIDRPVMLYYNGEKRNPPLTPQTGWGINSLCMHALLKNLGFETVLEYLSPAEPEKRRIFLGFKPGYYPGFIAANLHRSRPLIG